MNNILTNYEKKLSLISFWITFALTQIYGIVSGIALSSSGTPVESGVFLSIMALIHFYPLCSYFEWNSLFIGITTHIFCTSNWNIYRNNRVGSSWSNCFSSDGQSI